MEIDDSPVEHISVSVSVYLFAIRGTRERRRRKKKSYCLHSHGEEAQKKPNIYLCFEKFGYPDTGNKKATNLEFAYTTIKTCN